MGGGGVGKGTVERGVERWQIGIYEEKEEKRDRTEEGGGGDPHNLDKASEWSPTSHGLFSLPLCGSHTFIQSEVQAPP